MTINLCADVETSPSSRKAGIEIDVAIAVVATISSPSSRKAGIEIARLSYRLAYQGSPSSRKAGIEIWDRPNQ